MTSLGVFEDGSPSHRLSLEERWSKGPLIGFAGMNPSYASAEKTDATWTRGRGFAQRWGFGGQIFINPVPFRSSKPGYIETILRDLDNYATNRREVLRNNFKAVHKIARKPLAWILGWGEGGARFDKIEPCLMPFMDALRDGGAERFYAFNVTSSGQPIHILARGKHRVADDAKLYRYDFQDGALIGGSINGANLKNWSLI